MFNSIFFALVLIISVQGNGELNVLSYPKSIQFKSHDHLRESLLPEVYSSALGFSTEQDSNWQGIYLTDPFNLANVVVTVIVDGISTLDISKGHDFPLRTDEDESEIYNTLKMRVKARYPEGVNHLVRIDLADGLVSLQEYPEFQGVKSTNIKNTNAFLKVTIEEDKNFLEELSFLNGIIDQVEKGAIKHDTTPDIFWFKVSALHALSDLHGSNSSATKEAKSLLSDTILRLNDAFQKLYSQQALITVVTSDASHTRRIRRASTRADVVNFDNLNLAEVYSDDYPVIFNIILWFGVAFVFSLLAITIFIASMDPGRDSIIYRMTSTRMKKDN